MSVSTTLVTTVMVATLRRFVNEPAATTYDDDALKGIIVEYAVMDKWGVAPQYVSDFSTTPPTLSDDPDWTPTFDLHAAAAQVWQEKAGVLSPDFDFSADGGNYKRSQAHAHYMQQSRFHLSRRKPGTIKLIES